MSAELAPTDLYPSRVGEAPRWLDRRDPVVHGAAGDGPLSADLLTSYQAQGFLTSPLMFSEAELAPVQAELERLGRDPAVAAMPETITEPDSRALRSIFAVHVHNPVLRALCHHPRLVGVARQLLGGEVYLHQSRINFKPGFAGRSFDWHSDFETWHVEDGMPRMRAVSCAISLTENATYNGPLMVIPGSHRRFLACVGETPAEHFKQSLKRQAYGVPDRESLAQLVREGGITTLTGPAGTVTFFECNLMHGSNSNISPLPRHNVFMVFNSVENTLVDPYCGLAPRPPYIAERARAEPIPYRPERGAGP